MGDFKDLIVYKKAYQLAMEIFELSKKFPTEEKYSLTEIRSGDQQDRFVPILQKHIDGENINRIFFQSFQIVKQRIQKQKCGSILPKTAATFHQKNTTICKRKIWRLGKFFII